MRHGDDLLDGHGIYLKGTFCTTELAKVLLNPAVPVPRKRAAVDDLLAHAKFSPILSKLIVLLAGRDRLVLLPDLLASYRERLAKPKA